MNYGVIEGKRDTDFVAGTIPYKELNPTGNWKNYLPPGEWQHSNFADSMACVSFSLLNAIETQEKFLTGKQTNYSDRWLALMSETTPEGNYLYKVADTVRKYGLVKEESWPTPANFTWESYYAKPSAKKQAELLAEGKKWLETHTFAYEWIGTTLEEIQKNLKHTPLQVVIPGHAIEGFNEVGDTTHYFDSYTPFEKTTWRGNLASILKPVLTVKGTMNQFKTQNYKGELRVVLQASSPTEWEALCKIYGLDPKNVQEVVN